MALTLVIFSKLYGSDVSTDSDVKLGDSCASMNVVNGIVKPLWNSTFDIFQQVNSECLCGEARLPI